MDPDMHHELNQLRLHFMLNIFIGARTVVWSIIGNEGSMFRSMSVVDATAD